MVSNHSYVITGVDEVQYLDATAKLIRVRNPWGDTEWEGAWSDGYVMHQVQITLVNIVTNYSKLNVFGAALLKRDHFSTL